MLDDRTRISSVSDPSSTQTGQRGFLVALSPALAHREYVVGQERLVAGRDPDSCQVVVAGPAVSRAHFELRPGTEGQFTLRDLGSTNGTFVNRERVNERVLAEGDLIGLGTEKIVHLRFQYESGRNRPWSYALPAKPEWTIGRDPLNDVALAFESTVSSRHAKLTPADGKVEIADLGSLNGTWVNGRRVRRAKLDPADAVTIGSAVLRIQAETNGTLRITQRDLGEGIGLECVGLTRTVGNNKRILDRVSLAIQPGEFVGLLGPSGAGKSTLLKALNGYNPPGYGCVLVNETPLYRSFDMFRNSIGYVPQDDIVYHELTVEASLDYVARLRLPADVSDAQRHDLVEATLESLGLGHVRTSRVSELSGGQRKRVSIGCELITRPSLLFLDEPTSGLDPSTEERLMRHFQTMARRGNTILITTHILYNLDLLDRVVILSRGRLVFFGTPGEAMQFFSIDGTPVARPTQIFDLLEGEAGAVPTGEGDAKDRIAAHWQERYYDSPYFKRHVGDSLSDMGAALYVASDHPKSAEPQSKAETATLKPLLDKPTAGAGRGFSLDLVSPRALWTLTRRNLAIKLVSPKRALFYLAVPIILALVTLSLRTEPLPDDAEMTAARAEISQQLNGGPFPIGGPIKALLSPEGADDPRPAEDVVFALKHEGLPNLPTPISVLLMFVMTAVFTGTLMACLDLAPERHIYIRERMANQKIADYLLSKLPFLLTLTALQCAVFLGICYLNPGLRHMDPVGAYLALLTMAWTAVALGLFISAADPTPGQFAVILAIVAVLPQLVFSGGMAPDFYAGMSAPLQVLASLFPARWGLEMLMTAFYHQPDRTALAWAGDFVRDSVGFNFGTAVYWRNAAILLAQAAVWLLLCAVWLKRLDRAR